MEYIQKSKIKKFINSKGYRLRPDALDGINRTVEDVITSMLNNVEQDGMKTLLPQHTKVSNTIEKTSNKSPYVNIKPEFVKFAKSVQDYCHEQAVILSRKI
tara:strand:+ start:370 stop:672 length:303 start_codon:yes stop_codon:yes gene_type:complete